MRRGLRRVPVAAPTQQQHRTHTFPAPVRGKISNENLAASQPQGARVLELVPDQHRHQATRRIAPKGDYRLWPCGQHDHL
jgi:hypothetical protein